MYDACAGLSGSHFYPRPPRGGRQRIAAVPQVITRFLSTPSARRATAATLPLVATARISIHALREEGDAARGAPLYVGCYFYPRPPRGGRRSVWHKYTMAKKFLSTPSARRATLHQKVQWCCWTHFYPRPPRGGRPGKSGFSRVGATHFYPRPPRGGRPVWMAVADRNCPISIHALREEGDLRSCRTHITPITFLSTPSARRATCRAVQNKRKSDYFYPRPPRGGRP